MNHSVSAANTFRRCNRLYYYKYIEGWQSIHRAPWLEFGTKVDNLLEVLDKSNLVNAIATIPEKFTDVFEQAEVEFLLRLWHKQYGADPLPPVAVNGQPGNQFGFKREFNGNTITGLINMSVTGYIDKVTLIGNDHAVWEGKTANENIDPYSKYWTKLKLDPQIACYAWALSNVLGKPVNWVWYQAIRRPNPSANACFNRTHTVKGEEVPYRIEEYRARLEKVLEKGPVKPLVMRKKLYVSDDDKNLFIHEHAMSHQDIQWRKQQQAKAEEQGLPPEVAWPRNPGRCDEEGKSACEQFGGCLFWDVCAGKTTIEASGNFIKKDRNADKHTNQHAQV